MFIINQHIDDNDKNDINSIVTNITSIEDIDPKNINNADYLFINIDNTILNIIENIDDEINLWKHEKDCSAYNNAHNAYNSKMHTNIFTYITKQNLPDVFSNFKKINHKLNVKMISKKIENEFYLIPKIRSLGELIYAKSIDYPLNYKYSNDKYTYIIPSNKYKDQDDNKIVHLYLKELMNNKNIIIVENDINKLRDVYDFVTKVDQAKINNIKLYLYDNKQANANNNEDTMHEIEKQYCSCEFGGKLVNEAIIKSNATTISSLSDIKSISNYMIINSYNILRESSIGSEVRKSHDQNCNLFNYIYGELNLLSYLNEDNIIDILNTWRNLNKNTKIIIKVFSLYNTDDGTPMRFNKFKIKVDAFIADTYEILTPSFMLEHRILMDIFFNHNPNAINQTISIVDSDVDKLASIYKYYEKYNPNNLNKLHLYLYKLKDRLTELTNEHCNCSKNSNQNQRESKGGQNVTKTKHNNN